MCYFGGRFAHRRFLTLSSTIFDTSSRRRASPAAVCPVAALRPCPIEAGRASHRQEIPSHDTPTLSHPSLSGCFTNPDAGPSVSACPVLGMNPGGGLPVNVLERGAGRNLDGDVLDDLHVVVPLDVVRYLTDFLGNDQRCALGLVGLPGRLAADLELLGDSVFCASMARSEEVGGVRGRSSAMFSSETWYTG